MTSAPNNGESKWLQEQTRSFRTTLGHLWRKHLAFNGGPKQRIGRFVHFQFMQNTESSDFGPALAISGGVDSMALAFLCSHLKKAQSQNDLPHFHSNKSLSNFHFGAFIVDHKSRESSTLESLKIQEMLAIQGRHLLHNISNFEVLKVGRHSGRDSNVVLAVWGVSGESL